MEGALALVKMVKNTPKTALEEINMCVSDAIFDPGFIERAGQFKHSPFKVWLFSKVSKIWFLLIQGFESRPKGYM